MLRKSEIINSSNNYTSNYNSGYISDSPSRSTLCSPVNEISFSRNLIYLWFAVVLEQWLSFRRLTNHRLRQVPLYNWSGHCHLLRHSSEKIVRKHFLSYHFTGFTINFIPGASLPIFCHTLPFSSSSSSSLNASLNAPTLFIPIGAYTFGCIAPCFRTSANYFRSVKSELRWTKLIYLESYIVGETPFFLNSQARGHWERRGSGNVSVYAQLVSNMFCHWRVRIDSNFEHLRKSYGFYLPFSFFYL